MSMKQAASRVCSKKPPAASRRFRDAAYAKCHGARKSSWHFCLGRAARRPVQDAGILPHVGRRGFSVMCGFAGCSCHAPPGRRMPLLHTPGVRAAPRPTRRIVRADAFATPWFPWVPAEGVAARKRSMPTNGLLFWKKAPRQVEKSPLCHRLASALFGRCSPTWDNTEGALPTKRKARIFAAISWHIAKKTA